MRKITLFAGAAILASSAMAAGPAVASNNKVEFKAQKYQHFEPLSKASVSALRAADLSRADEGTANGDPNYYTPGGFYTGVSNQWYSFNSGKAVMIAPSRGYTQFVPTAEFTDSRWTFYRYELNESGDALEPVGYYADVDTLLFPNAPYSQTSGLVTLSGTNADGASVSYTNAKINSMLCGRNAEEWGLGGADDGGTYGLSPVPCGTPASDDATGRLYIWGGYYGFDKSDATANENGVFEAVCKGEDATFPETEFSDVKLIAYETEMPSPGSWYQLSGIYFLCRSVNTADISITVNVYEIDGNEISEKPVGKGSTIIAANSADEPFYDFLNIELSGVNVLGYSTNRPICSDKALYFEITGFSGDEVESFYMMMNATQTVSLAEWSAQSYWRKLYPSRAYVIYSMTDLASGETVVDHDPYIHAYYEDQENYATSKLCITNNFLLYYDLTFPQVFDAYTGADEFTVNVSDGPQEVYVDGSFDFAQLYDDGIMNATASDSWINFEVSYDEDEEYTVVTVSAEALPEGETGRSGKIEFTGYACDFTINVVQGEGGGNEEGSISEVKTAADGVSEYYDLQGRKLSAAPAKGLYIERNGSAATTKIAR